MTWCPGTSRRCRSPTRRRAWPTCWCDGSRSARCRSVHGADDATAAAPAGRREHARDSGRGGIPVEPARRDRAQEQRPRQRPSLRRSWIRSVKCGATVRPRCPGGRRARHERPGHTAPRARPGRRDARRPHFAAEHLDCRRRRSRPALLGVVLVVAVLPRLLSTPTEPCDCRDARGRRGGRDPSHSGDAVLRRRQRPGARAGQPARCSTAPRRSNRRGASSRPSSSPRPKASARRSRTARPSESVFLAADGNTFVDLGGAIVTGHSGGSLNEALTVYAIVNAVTVNLPDIAARADSRERQAG